MQVAALSLHHQEQPTCWIATAVLRRVAAVQGDLFNALKLTRLRWQGFIFACGRYADCVQRGVAA